MKTTDRTVTRCPCRRAVPLDYTTRDRRQAELVMRFVDQFGEFMNVNVGGRWYRVSRATASRSTA